VQQWQKETITKLVNAAYLAQPINFDPQLLTFVSPRASSSETIILLCIYSIVGLLALECLVLICIFFSYEGALERMYSIFLSVNDRKLQQIMEECQRLCDYLLQFPNNNLEAELEGRKEDGGEDEESPIVKKIKRSNESRDYHFAYRLVLPVLAMLGMTLTSGVVATLYMQTFRFNREVWR
jgi:hypothetical protein